MDDFEYTNKLIRALGLLEEVQNGGMMALMKCQAEIMELAPVVLGEAASRHGIKRAVNNG